MEIENLKKELKNKNSKGYNIVQTTSRNLVLFKSKYKYTDCIYISIDECKAHVKTDRVFDNKFFYNGIERMFIKEETCKSSDELVKYIGLN